MNLEQSPVNSLGIVQLKVNNYRIVLNLKNRNNYDLNIYCYICKTKSEKSLDKFKSILEKTRPIINLYQRIKTKAYHQSNT